MQTTITSTGIAQLAQEINTRGGYNGQTGWGYTVILVLDECVAAYEESATRWQSHTKQTECGAEFYSHMGGGSVRSMQHEQQVPNVIITTQLVIHGILRQDKRPTVKELSARNI